MMLDLWQNRQTDLLIFCPLPEDTLSKLTFGRSAPILVSNSLITDEEIARGGGRTNASCKPKRRSLPMEQQNGKLRGAKK